ncbi:MAG TPA: ATP-binding protein [Roseomonas sp.]
MSAVEDWLTRTRLLGLPARGLGGLILGLLAGVLHASAFPEDGSYAYVFAFPAVVAASIAFGRTSGSVTLLTTASWIAFSMPPRGSFAISEEGDVIGLLIYATLATGVLVLIQSLLHQRARALEAEADAIDIAARHAAREREHEVLIAEFRHRVKNDLARLAATFSLRAANAGPEIAEALRAAADRARMFSSIYDQMTLRDGHMVTDMHEFLRDLVRDINATIEREHPVGLTLHAEAHTLPFGQASAIAIIVNELVTNALKHAFPDDREGTISIEFRREGQEFVLGVRDDGIGIPPDVEPSRGQGSRIVRALAAQVNGHLLTAPATPTGTHHELRFKRMPGAGPG